MTTGQRPAVFLDRDGTLIEEAGYLERLERLVFFPFAIDAVRLGATYYLSKPADADDIVAAFARGEAPPLAPPDIEYKAPSLARAEWEHINRVLSDCGGNISEAARRLGIHRRSLQRKLQKYPPNR